MKNLIILYSTVIMSLILASGVLIIIEQMLKNNLKKQHLVQSILTQIL